jgi:CheY-like chemotaxis protein
MHAPLPSDPASRLHAWVVEDHPVARDFLCLMLSRLGHAVHSVPDAESALAALPSCRRAPDVAFVGLGLPGQCGRGLARALREALGRFPFLVAVSSFDGAAEWATADRAGFDAFLPRPFRLEELLGRLEEAAGSAGWAAASAG